MPTFTLGQTATVRRTYHTADLLEWQALAGGRAPGPAVDRTVPGPLLAALFSYLLGTTLPGRGTNYLKQHLVYPAPANIDEELTASVEILRLRPEKGLINLRTVCTAPDGRIVCEGEALVLVRDDQTPG